MKNVNAAIDRASNVITKTQDPRDGMDESILAKRVAEAKFLRALYLFDIVRNWGQAPLICMNQLRCQLCRSLIVLIIL